MSARRFCNAVYSMLVEANGPDEVEEMLRGKRRWRETVPADEVTWEEVA